jgi:transposase
MRESSSLQKIMKSSGQIAVSNLDHLGLVAGMIDEIGIVEIINRLIGEEAGEKVSPGQAVKAMIINGLGLVSAPLYLFSRFFEGKATEHLIGSGIKAEYLNDDRLGRVLDKLYLKGLSEIFIMIALGAAKKFRVSVQTAHLDASSFHVHGEYKEQLPQAIKITYGYSRDHRPDLKQFIVDLICSEDGDVPLYLRVADGNESDQTAFGKILCEFRNKLEVDALMVADSALYSEANLQQIAGLRWLTRVPLTIKKAQKLLSEPGEEDFCKSVIPGYSWCEQSINYGGIKQRWLVVESDERQASDLKRLAKNIQKADLEAVKKLRQLSRQIWACIPDALKAAKKLSQELKYHQLTAIEVVEVSPKSPEMPANHSYKITATLELKTIVVKAEQQQAGRFILATNILDTQQLSNDEMLSKYKNQQAAERGFSFLKDPLFFTDSVFLKSAERIEALALIMGLCLLVYTLAQRQLRQALISANATVKNQLGKQTIKPTLRWIFQCFQAVHLLIIEGKQQIANLTVERQRILSFFPASCLRYYLLI